MSFSSVGILSKYDKMADCYKQYRAYKAVCLDEEPTFDTDVQALDVDGVEKLYRSTVKQLLAARACVQGRKWVKENCYSDASDEGHDRAIEVATDHVKLIESRLTVIVSRLVQLRNAVAPPPELPEHPEETNKASRSVRRRRNQRKKKVAVEQQVEHDTEEWYNEAIKEKEYEVEKQRDIGYTYIIWLKMWLDSPSSEEDPKKQWMRQTLCSASGNVIVEATIIDDVAKMHREYLTSLEDESLHSMPLTPDAIYASFEHTDFPGRFFGYMQAMLEIGVVNYDTDTFGVPLFTRFFVKSYIAHLYQYEISQVTYFLTTNAYHARNLYDIFIHYN